MDGLSRDLTYGFTVVYACKLLTDSVTAGYRLDWLVKTGQDALIDKTVTVDGAFVGTVKQVPWSNIDAAVDEKVADRPVLYLPDQYTILADAA